MGLNRTHGFTLIEMLLTVFLIGLVTSIAVINVGQDDNDIAKLEAKRFAALVTHLQDESTLIGFPMGVEVSESENRYRFWMLEDKWALIDRQDVLRERQVPDRVEMSVKLLHSTEEESASDNANDDPENDAEQVESKKSDAPPRNLLMVEPTGLIRPFIASFRGDSQIFRVSLDVFLNPVVSSESI